MPETAHQCELPWTGALFCCPVCGTWFEVVVFRDNEHDLSWKGWQPLADADVVVRGADRG